MYKHPVSHKCKDSTRKVAASQPRDHVRKEICKEKALPAFRKPPKIGTRVLNLLKQDQRETADSIKYGCSQSVDLKAKPSALKHSTDAKGERSHLEPILYAGRLLDNGNNRQGELAINEIRTPKPILAPSRSPDTKKGAGHVTFQCSPEPSPMDAVPWTVRPLLGYDWIAGLLETDCSLAEKSEQYFSELNEFRRVNQEECIHTCYSDSQPPDFLSLDDDKEIVLGPHECVFCYRVNKRLFPVPLNPEGACPVCKSPRSKQSGSVAEPAYVRVSIPRSTLLPPHKYKVHRRRSFDPSDSLSLPSHCLAGWEKTVPSSEHTVTGLDLRTSLAPKPVEGISLHNTDLVSRVSGSARSDHLLNVSRSAYFLQNKATRSGLIPAINSSVA
ncbi:migration and invasion-inhibitory protein isoform X2 [Ambystoma mexicanum]|uniref:migration and invasion-inhibitory protein isoform X2 n=1 Tax=Ambystoma mexicanum TaxID=8296 RepID=UPI0037E9B7DC